MEFHFSYQFNFSVPDHIQEQEQKRISSLSNSDLLNQMIQIAGGDDWDGDLTQRGKCVFTLCYKELQVRLADWLAK